MNMDEDKRKEYVCRQAEGMRALSEGELRQRAIEQAEGMKNIYPNNHYRGQANISLWAAACDELTPKKKPPSVWVRVKGWLSEMLRKTGGGEMGEGLRYARVSDWARGQELVIQVDGGGVAALFVIGEDYRAVAEKLHGLADRLILSVESRRTPQEGG